MVVVNKERLKYLHENLHLMKDEEVFEVKNLIRTFPYYALPYEIMARYTFHQGGDFEKWLLKASLRVKDRKVLFDYIHSEWPVIEPKITSVEDFLNDGLEEEEIEEVDTFQTEESTVEPTQPKEDLSEEKEEIHEEATSSIEEVSMLSETSPEPEIVELTESAELQIDDEPEFKEESQETINEETISEDKPEEFVLHAPIENMIQKEYEQFVEKEELETEFTFSDRTEPEQDTVTFETKTSEPEAIQAEIEKVVEEEEIVIEKNEIITEKPETGYSEKHNFFEWLNQSKEESGAEIGDIEEKVEEIVEETVDPGETESIEEIKDLVADIQDLGFNSNEDSDNSNVHLDLIQKFIENNPQVSRPKKEFYSAENMAKKSEIPDMEYVTETLAQMYLEQGNTTLAIQAYEKLSLQNPEKQAYFADLIKKIRKEK